MCGVRRDQLNRSNGSDSESRLNMPDKALENVLQNLDGREIARCQAVRQMGVTLRQR